MRSFALMYISKAKKYRDMKDGTAKAYPYYRLTKSYRDSNGRPCTRSVLCLGELEGFEKEDVTKRRESHLTPNGVRFGKGLDGTCKLWKVDMNGCVNK